MQKSTIPYFEAYVMRFLQGLMSSSRKIDLARVPAKFLKFMAETTPIFMNTFPNISGLNQHTVVYSTSF